MPLGAKADARNRRDLPQGDFCLKKWKLLHWLNNSLGNIRRNNMGVVKTAGLQGIISEQVPAVLSLYSRHFPTLPPPLIDNSPAIHGWVVMARMKSPSRDGRKNLSSRPRLGGGWATHPSHKWLGYSHHAKSQDHSTN